MFDNQAGNDLFHVPDALEALGQLEENTSQAILSKRASERIEIRTKLTIHPGNSSERHAFAVEGLTGDLSNGGCQVLLARPLLPGDVYWLSFSDDHVAIGSLLARCMRCRMIREDTFEAGFRFFRNVDLSAALRHRDDHEW